MQPIQFGALTRSQERMIERNLPGGISSAAISANSLPGSEILDFMEEEGLKILGAKPLGEDAFVPSEDFMAAETDLAGTYEDIGGDDDSPKAIVRRSGAGAVLKQQAAGRLLAAIRQSDAFFVSDRLVLMLIRALQN